MLSRAQHKIEEQENRRGHLTRFAQELRENLRLCKADRTSGSTRIGCGDPDQCAADATLGSENRAVRVLTQVGSCSRVENCIQPRLG